MDTAQWSQGIEMSSSAPPQSQQVVERRAIRPVKEQALNCPRCNSTNTKFCYYNNYSLTQPRYFCKACRRYWTEGGSLRNVPVGGGSRKNKKHSSSSSSSSSATTKFVNNNIPPPHPPPISTSSSSFQIPQISAAKPYQGQDLNLGFPELIGGFHSNNNIGGGLSAMELLRSTGITPLVHMSMPETGAGFGLHDHFSSPSGIKFSLDDNGNMQEGGGRLLFPFGDLKMKPSNESDEQIKGQGGDPTLFWGGANLGGGGGGGGGGSW